MFEIELFICIKMFLTLNNLQRLICYKTLTDKQAVKISSRSQNTFVFDRKKKEKKHNERYSLTSRHKIILDGLACHQNPFLHQLNYQPSVLGTVVYTDCISAEEEDPPSQRVSWVWHVGSFNTMISQSLGVNLRTVQKIRKELERVDMPLNKETKRNQKGWMSPMVIKKIRQPRSLTLKNCYQQLLTAEFTDSNNI